MINAGAPILLGPPRGPGAPRTAGPRRPPPRPVVRSLRFRGEPDAQACFLHAHAKPGRGDTFVHVTLLVVTPFPWMGFCGVYNKVGTMYN